MARTSYVVALGSNRRGRHGSPRAEIAAALAAIGGVTAVSPIVTTPPLGPSLRRFANAAAIIESDEAPPALLCRLKAIEQAFGRRRGRRWGARVIDLDIILWSGGAWADARLTVPHRAFRARGFVLGPLLAIAPGWRDPLTGRTVRQLAHRQRAVDRRARDA
ncbi:2-amino-4-hydroxy-6-hydroxymethyldihydropteridine diphosphokinase [Hephaestia caeni]|uniref:2-amino-4-hydroxy-6-hydroxymethyldihydropteridine pyrophosphokinase n=1 Tax=Hephaestia caeni TaxID=645617 RepID=A0A397P9M6_9SPHN|nr:2-amino-4-hydroxy-6-hydroxymethyldihydropteridine diphosphokinase [Hephaestia caeni]RIA43897.1 2-amino-4-hydroxy-6-hydroxymethyldihydropteridine diphosphokinase [Hephaestia caeni]